MNADEKVNAGRGEQEDASEKWVKVGVKLIGVVIWLLAGVSVWWAVGKFGDLYARMKGVNPPLSVTMREGILSRNVIQVNNLSSEKGVEVCVYARNGASKWSRSPNVVIPANANKEFGLLEMKWRFAPGDTGFVAAPDYLYKLCFEIMDGGKYRTWFSRPGDTDDVAEVDVPAADQTR